MATIQPLSRESVRTPEELDIDIARTGPGTPGGKFLRRFWTPLMRAEDVPVGHAKPLRVLSEDFTIFRTEGGKAQLVDYRCPHRGAMMHLGWVEGEEIRCVYHGWKFDCSGQCTEQPAEEPGFARKVQIKTYPTGEFLGLIWGYFGEGAAPAFPPIPAPQGEGLLENPPTVQVACNYLQSFENSLDEVHVSFVHRAGGSHQGMYDLPEIGCEETPWGMLRTGRRQNGEVRVSLHYMPNITRVIVPPMAGFDGVGGWKELYLTFTPVDDENHIWNPIYMVRVTGKDVAPYLKKREQYERTLASTGPSWELAEKVRRGEVRFQDIKHPDLVRVQDIASQTGQGRIADRSNERLGKSDAAIILWRKILAREMRAIAEGKPPKQWATAPDDVVPTLGF